MTGTNKRPRVCGVKNTHLKSSCGRNFFLVFSHTLRYFGLLNVWSGLHLPVESPLGLDLLYVYPVYVNITQCIRGVLDPPISVFVCHNRSVRFVTIRWTEVLATSGMKGRV